MELIRMGVIGSGWRARIFMRIIHTLAEVFSLQAVYFRNSGKAKAFEAEWPGVASADFEHCTKDPFCRIPGMYGIRKEIHLSCCGDLQQRRNGV